MMLMRRSRLKTFGLCRHGSMMLATNCFDGLRSERLVSQTGRIVLGGIVHCL